MEKHDNTGQLYCLTFDRDVDLAAILLNAYWDSADKLHHSEKNPKKNITYGITDLKIAQAYLNKN